MDYREILKKIERLALSYTPEWRVDFDNPDAGAVIAMIYAKQMNDSRKMYDGMNETFHEQYIRMLQITPRRAYASKVLLQLEVTKGNRGIMLPRSTCFIADMDDDGRGIFESCTPVYVSQTGISRIIVENGTMGQKILKYGKNYVPRLLGEETECITVERFDGIDFKSRADREEPEAEAVFFHHNAFHDMNVPITIRFHSNMKLGDEINEGNFCLMYPSDGGIKPLKVTAARADYAVVFFFFLPRYYTMEDDTTEQAVILRRMKNNGSDCVIDKIEVTGRLDRIKPDFMLGNNIECTGQNIQAFGNSIGVYQEFVIGSEQCFIHSGAQLTISFELSFEERVLGEPPKPEPDLRIIKRKPQNEIETRYTDVRVDKVVYEYYSAAGWRTLNITDENAAELFDGRYVGKMVLHTSCPDDWIRADMTGYNGYAMRIRIVRADNCYNMPSRHLIPLISGLELGYDNSFNPAVIERYELVSGYEKRKGTGFLEGIRLKGELNDKNAIYIGLDGKPEYGPVNIFFKTENRRNAGGGILSFEYSSDNGFKTLGVIDNTNGFSTSGIVSFIPPSDFGKISIMGADEYFMRVVFADDDTGRELPIVEEILFNVVEAENVHTLEPIEFSIERPQADMKFKLGIDNLYDARVWVNEIDSVTSAEAEEYIKYNPDKCRAEYDMNGSIRSFYRLWTETESFSDCDSIRCYRLDRTSASICFSDGIHKLIPKVTGDTAFIVEPRVCDGRSGNVPAGSIGMGLGTANRISRIRNPYPAFGGTDFENVSRMFTTQAFRLGTGNRLITAGDYERVAESFSENIDKAKCLCDTDGDINIVLLMRDFSVGDASFYRMKTQLIDYIESCCEITATGSSKTSLQKIKVVLPVYVKVSVTLWVHVYERENSYSLINEIDKALKEFLEPVSSEGRHGWDIGEFPDKNQIMVRLKFIEKKASIKELSLSCSYVDDSGYHETDIENISISPYMVVCSGTHKYRMA